jgi:hypothetical protein
MSRVSSAAFSQREWLQPYTTGPHPLREARSRQRHSRTLKDAFQAVQRLVVGILRHQDVRQQSRRRDALIKDLRRHRRLDLDQLLATTTYPFATHVAVDLEEPRQIVELLTHILAKALQRASASALRVLRFVLDAYSSDREQRFHAMVNGAWGWQLESEFLRQVFTIRQGIA